MRADQIMTSPVITIRPDASIVEAATRMLDRRISGLPVVNAANELVGIISEDDFIRRAEIGTQRKRGHWLALLVGPARLAADFVREEGRKVEEIMTPAPLTTISRETPLQEVAQLMETNNIKRLPVVRGSEVVGIVTRSNLVRAVAHLARDELRSIAGDDARIRDAVFAAIRNAIWSPTRLGVLVRHGNVSLFGSVTDRHAAQASIVAAENVPGVRKVYDCFSMYPPPEEDLGGGDFVSLQEEPSTTDDMPL